MNKRNLSILIAAATASVLVCCSKQNETDPKIPENGDGQFQSLELTSVRESEFQSKAVVDGETFPQDGHIGLFLFANAAASQTYGDGYTNVDYSYNSTKEKWTASPSIKVGSTPGYLYGYYPYKAGNQQQPVNIKAIPVVSSFNGDDVMYATPQDPITDQTAGNVSVTMKHALARVCITVVNKGYTGNAKLSKIKFSGAEIAPEGTLNALDGSVTATKSDVTLDVTGDAQTITTAGTIYECLLVPSKAVESKQDVNLTLTIDGEDKTASLSDGNGVIIAQGTKSNITITLSNSGISVQTVSVDDWNVVEVGGHKVTISVADGIEPNDILTKAYVDGNNVIIRASSNAGQHLKCTLPGGELCPQSKTDNLVYTFTLSNIKSDIVATIGYAKSFILNVSSNNTDWGKVIDILPNSCYEGEKISITATAASGCKFIEWQDADAETLGKSNPLYITLTSDITAKAVFEAPSTTFSISDDGGKTTKQILFSQGNLYYYGTKFYFETKQYEYHTYDSENGTWGLFGWVGSFSRTLIEQPLCYGVSTSQTPLDYGGTETLRKEPLYEDWGATMGAGWRTLSNNEWQYLFEGRQNAANKYGFATVNGVHGIIILPDSFNDPKTNNGGDLFVPISNVDTNVDTNVYTTQGNWEAMENAGAVFLPAAGRRSGSKASENEVSGRYWSSSSDIEYRSYGIDFTTSTINTSVSIYRYFGCSVRLVKEAK